MDAEERGAAKAGGFSLRSLLKLPVPSISLVALALSGFSVYLSMRSSEIQSRAEAIGTQYSLFTELTKMQIDRPLMSHLFALSPIQYDRSIQTLAPVVASLDAKERGQLILQEAAVANHIFTIYEDSYYRLANAHSARDEIRKSMYADAMENFFKPQMCNRRLIWYWDAEHGQGLENNSTEEVRNHFTNVIQPSCSAALDSVGPFSR